MSERTKTRRMISMVLALSMIVGGVSLFSWMFLNASAPSKMYLWMVPITIFSIGVVILWEDIKEWRSR